MKNHLQASLFLSRIFFIGILIENKESVILFYTTIKLIFYDIRFSDIKKCYRFIFLV